ncbi:hypothetical protein AOQ84DRAFT_352738 [Glonium stellatum]|uniref:Uncharacterized protein n=1 Tax=Glonium stellatum TaxID=574774 RepID=A0A8E2JW96_9PEZI|nr:hypothetical protein AOQ84DRAFT_352738 [Glonium stellatum]
MLLFALFLPLTAALPRTLPGFVSPVSGTYGNPGGVYYCTGANWTGACGYTDNYPGVCHGLGNGFFKTTRSIGPNPMTTCRFWDNDSCKNEIGWSSMQLVFPGNPDLQAIGWADRAQSFKCEI